MSEAAKPAAWKFQRRDSYNGRVYWDVTLSDPTDHPYRAGGPVVPLYESKAEAEATSKARVELTLAAFDALEREATSELREVKAAVRMAARKRL